MLTELCQELKNWFDRERHTGTFEIVDGSLTADFLVEGQYYRVCGSIFNDGVHQYGEHKLRDETFDGAVWALAIPAPVIKLSTEIEAWRGKYEAADSAALSPFTSESFGGYSYTLKSSASSEGGSDGLTGWREAFRDRLNAFRKIS
jgi:hypothetical protein